VVKAVGVVHVGSCVGIESLGVTEGVVDAGAGELRPCGSVSVALERVRSWR
jgi:hypothetical protein